MQQQGKGEKKKRERERDLSKLYSSRLRFWLQGDVTCSSNVCESQGEEEEEEQEEEEQEQEEEQEEQEQEETSLEYFNSSHVYCSLFRLLTILFMKKTFGHPDIFSSSDN